VMESCEHNNIRWP